MYKKKIVNSANFILFPSFTEIKLNEKNWEILTVHFVLEIFVFN